MAAWKAEGESEDGPLVHQERSCQLRFDPDEVAEFKQSREGKQIMWGLFFMALFYMWPYQTLVQVQRYLSMKFNSGPEVENVMMICTTWPRLIVHTLMTFSGFSRKLPYTCKIVVPSLLMACLAVYLLVVLQTSADEELLLASLYGSALVGSIVEGIVLPSSYDMAGLYPSPEATMCLQAGNGAAGLIVSCVNIGTRLAVTGRAPTTLLEAERLTSLYLVAWMAIMALLLICIFMLRMRSTESFDTYVRSERRLEPGSAGALSDAGSESESDDADEGFMGVEGVREGDMVSRALEAISYVWPGLFTIMLTVATSLALLPVILGMTCLDASPEAMSARLRITCGWPGHGRHEHHEG
eukprot:TRINITY_DN6700_c0_g1_i1.p1 TRINITY_DN6700_c0_g1~~TRINITY_DN6700_c0_g1_i1.p1  ORF type:complete len:355 (+),score=65.40 TRINITY_DN6700_c0_g1_i1:65-1129(+)